MAQKEITKQEMLDRATAFFRETIVPNHLSNLRKLRKLKTFNYNPFLLDYLAVFLGGGATPENIAKVLVYPRILGTSINTSFGNNVQRFCSTVLPGFGSAVSGVDMEYLDKVDGRKKYCQIKAGPNTINKDDVETIDRHFTAVRNLARTNHLDVQLDDLVIGVLYGTTEELSANYKKLKNKYPVYSGKEFWYRLTGDEDFYSELIDAFGVVAKESAASKELNEVIRDLAKEVAEMTANSVL